MKEIVYKGDVICARCVSKEVCRFGGVRDDFDKCEEFKRDWNVLLRARPKLRKRNE